MTSAAQPVIEFLATTFRLADENERHVHEVLRLAERFQRAATHRAASLKRLHAQARERIRRLYANAERLTHHLAQFEQHGPTAPLQWHSTIRESIKVGTRRAVLARRAAVAMQNIFEPPVRLEAEPPGTLVH